MTPPPLPPWAALEVASPVALLALGLALPIVLLHLYHRRRLVVAHLPLLREAVGARRPGGGFRRVREALPLALRLGALTAFALALAGLAPAAGPPPPALVLVVDADSTTRAREADGRTRRQRSLELGAAWARSRPWREVVVLDAHPEPLPLVVPPCSATEAARQLELRAREGDTTSSGRSDLPAALARARALVRELAPARAVIVTSREIAGADASDVEVVGAGSTRTNQGLVDLQVGAAQVGGRHEVRVLATNEDVATVRRTLVARVDEAEVDRQTLELRPGETTTATVTVLPPRGGAWLDLLLLGDDAFADDDTVTVRLEAPPRPSVLVVHEGGVRPYTRAVLEAMDDALDAQASGVVAAEDLARAAPRDVFLVDGARVPTGGLRPGAWLFLAPLGGELPFDVDPVVREPLVWRTAPDHPLLLDVDLTTTFVSRAYPVHGPGVVSLAEADGRIVLGEGRRADLRYVVLGLDADASDLPVRTALPLLVRNALRRLAGGEAPALPPFLRPGDVLRPRRELPGGPQVEIRWPGGSGRWAQDGSRGTWTVPPGARGAVTLATSEGVVARTAFVDLSETRRIRPARAPAPPPAPAPEAGARALRWRRALLVLGLLLLLLDVLLVSLARGKLARSWARA